MTRRMKLVFTLSFLLNIVLIGAGAGLYYRYHEDGPMPPDMSPKAREFLSGTYKSGREEMKPLIDEIKERRGRVEDILTAETFDRAAYDAAVASLLDQRDVIGRKKADIMGRALADLPAEDRRAFARQIVEGLTGHRSHRRPQGMEGGQDGVRRGGDSSSSP